MCVYNILIQRIHRYILCHVMTKFSLNPGSKQSIYHIIWLLFWLLQAWCDILAASQLFSLSYILKRTSCCLCVGSLFITDRPGGMILLVYATCNSDWLIAALLVSLLVKNVMIFIAVFIVCQALLLVYEEY